MSELFTKEVQSKRVDAWIDEAQTEANDLEDVPEEIVVARIVVEPECVNVSGKPAHKEDEDEG